MITDGAGGALRRAALLPHVFISPPILLAQQDDPVAFGAERGDDAVEVEP